MAEKLNMNYESVKVQLRKLLKKFSLLIIVAPLCVALSVAQDASSFHGTWFHSDFITSLQRENSVSKASSYLTAHQPLYIVIDGLSEGGEVLVCYTPNTLDTLLLRKTVVGKMGVRWVLGDKIGPIWMITTDVEKLTYVALQRLDSIEINPIVMGKLPSKNQDPKFLLQRMINASILAGKYADSRGKLHEFNTNMTAMLNGNRINTRIKLSDDYMTIILVGTTENGKESEYFVHRTTDTLTLSQKNGTQITLKKL